MSKKLEKSIKKDSDYPLKSIKEDKSFQILKLAADELKLRYDISDDELLRLIKQPASKEILIPISVFETHNLSALEIVCKYLKEELDLGYSKIASLLNRNSRTIWATYNNALLKRKEKLLVKDSKFYIPILIFTNRKLSVLESIVSYLKDNFNLRYSEISVLLNRDERNIWTVYNRYKKKK